MTGAHAPDRTRLLSAVVESSGDAIYTLTHDGIVTAWNPAAVQLYGFREPEITGATIDRFMEPAAAATLRQVLDELLRISSIVRLEMTHRHRSGAPVEVSLSLSPVRTEADTPATVAVIARDVTRQKLAEEQFRLAMEANPLGLVLVDHAGTIQMLNGTLERMFGYTRSELMGQHFELLLPLARRAAHRSHFGEFVKAPWTREAHEQRDLAGRRKDGQEFAAEVALTPLTTRRGAMVMASIFDKTAEREEAAVRDRQRLELQRSNQELAQFAYVASHDLQEPLRMVASYTQLLAERYQGQLDERADKYIRYIVEGATRMQRLVTDLLALSRIESQARPPRLVDVGALVERVLADLAARIEDAGATITVEPLPRLLADEGQLSQVFQNLICNAIKFVTSGRVPEVHVRADLAEGEWRFAVTDNGIGIAPEFTTRIFDMFQRLHPRGQYDGNGIGLAVAKKIVERHHGRIWLESALGEGTTFFFTLPAGGVQ